MTGVATKIHTHDDGAVTFERVQDCTPILEHATALHNEGLHGSGDMRHAASLPFVLVERYCNDHNITYRDFMQSPDHLKRVLNDPALAYFRIWPGKV